MRKNKFIVMTTFVLCFLLGLNLIEVEASSSQSKLDEKFISVLTENNLTLEEFHHIGSRYYTENGQLVVQIKENSQGEDFSALANDFMKKSDVIVERVKYSDVELYKIQDQLWAEILKLDLSAHTKFSVDTENNSLILQTPFLTEVQKQRILEMSQEHGENFVELDVDPEHGTLSKRLILAVDDVSKSNDSSYRASSNPMFFDETKLADFNESIAVLGTELILPIGLGCPIIEIGFK